MSFPYRVCAVSIPAIAAAGALSAQTVIELDEITATASLTAVETNRTGATVDVIDAEEIERERKTQLLDLLRGRAGLSATSNGGIGTDATLRIRGLGRQYIAVRVDGIDISDASQPQIGYDFGKMTPADIGRIEIVKGTQSALYGSAAVAGVIDITSRRAQTPGTTVTTDIETGTYDTLRGAMNIATLGASGEVSLTLSHVNTAGFSAADENDGNPEADGYEATRLSFFAAQDVSDRLRIGLNGFVEEYDLEFDSGIGPADGPQFDEGRSRGLRAFAEIDGDTVRHTIAATGYDITRAGDFGGFPYDYSSDRQTVEYLGSTELGATVLSFGARFSDESFYSGSEGAAGDRRTAAVFTEALYPIGAAADLSISLRQDDYSDFGGFTSGRLALAYRPSEPTTLRAVLSNGFRAPSLYELNAPFIGNPALAAEESVTAELGVEHRYASGARVQATLFHTEIDNLVQFSGGAYNQVAGKSTTQGIELSGEAPLSDGLEIFGSYTFTDATAPDGSQTIRVPEHDLTLGMSAQLSERISASGSIQAVRGLIDVGGPLPDYEVAYATVSYAVSETTQTYLRIENLFDEEYQTIEGYGTSDRAFYVGLRAQF